MGDRDLRERLSCLNPRSLIFQMRVVWFLSYDWFLSTLFTGHHLDLSVWKRSQWLYTPDSMGTLVLEDSRFFIDAST